MTGDQAQWLTSTQVLNLFRIVQGALNSAIKHARATQSTVRLQVRPGRHIRLRVYDNGNEFTWVNGTIFEQHYGWRKRQTCAEELGGSFRVFTEDGTTVDVAI